MLPDHQGCSHRGGHRLVLGSCAGPTIQTQSYSWTSTLFQSQRGMRSNTSRRWRPTVKITLHKCWCTSCHSPLPRQSSPVAPSQLPAHALLPQHFSPSPRSRLHASAFSDTPHCTQHSTARADNTHTICTDTSGLAQCCLGCLYHILCGRELAKCGLWVHVGDTTLPRLDHQQPS